MQEFEQRGASRAVRYAPKSGFGGRYPSSFLL